MFINPSSVCVIPFPNVIVHLHKINLVATLRHRSKGMSTLIPPLRLIGLGYTAEHSTGFCYVSPFAYNNPGVHPINLHLSKAVTTVQIAFQSPFRVSSYGGILFAIIGFEPITWYQAFLKIPYVQGQ